MPIDLDTHVLRPALGTLVGVFEWQSLCINQFSGRITKAVSALGHSLCSQAQAGEMTVADVLESVPRNPGEKSQWKQAGSTHVYTYLGDVERESFLRPSRTSSVPGAWPCPTASTSTLELRAVDFAVRCLQIPETMREYRLSEEDAMLWCIPDQKDDGLFALAVIDWLVAQHNEVVQIVAGTMAYPTRKVSSRLLAQHDVARSPRFQLETRCETAFSSGGRTVSGHQVTHEIP